MTPGRTAWRRYARMVRRRRATADFRTVQWSGGPKGLPTMFVDRDGAWTRGRGPTPRARHAQHLAVAARLRQCACEAWHHPRTRRAYLHAARETITTARQHRAPLHLHPTP